MKLVRLSRWATPHLKRFEEERVKLLKRYGKEVSEGKWEVPNECKEDFFAEFKKLCESPVSLNPALKFEVAALGDIKITAIAVEQLSAVLTDMDS